MIAVMRLYYGCGWLDLNQRPLGYEPSELPDCSTPPYNGCGGRIRTSDHSAYEAGKLPLLYPAISKSSFETVLRSVNERK